MRLGKELRLTRIIRPEDNRSVVVAADHGMALGPIKGIINLEETLKNIVKGGPDAVMLTPGSMNRLGYLFKGRSAPGLIMRIDWTNVVRPATYKVLPPRRPTHILLANVKDALHIGADAVMGFFFLGYENDEHEARDYEIIAKLAQECEDVGMPLMVETIPLGPRVTGANYPDLLALAVRMSIEAGADALKIPYSQDKETFSKVVKAAGGAPVFVLGGSKAISDREPLEMLVEALEVGATGVVYGRNVIQSPDPAKMLKMIKAIVHEGKSIGEALSCIEAEG